MTPQPAIATFEQSEPVPDLVDAPCFGLKADSHACGLATRSDGESTITVVILPKFWSPPETRRQIVWNENDDKLVVPIYENQSCTLILSGEDPDQTGRRQKLIHALIKQVENTVSKTEGQEKPLFKLVAPKDYKDYKDYNFVPTPTTEQLLNLLFMVHKTLPEEIPTSPDGSLTQQDVLTPLIQWAFVDEVKQQIHSLRRGYVSKTETLSVIRGRVDVFSAAMVDHGLRQNVLCHFDTFTEHTPLLRVLVTALEVVCGGDWRQVLGDGGPLGRALRDEAIGLCRILSSVIPYTRSQALMATRGIRFHRLNRRFERSIRLAIQVIAGSASDASASGEVHTGGWIWSVDMSKLWERTLQHAFDAKRKEGERIEYYEQKKPPSSMLLHNLEDENKPGIVEAPWVGVGGVRKPDLLSIKGDKGWVIDAKYKGTSAKPNELPSPRAVDQNQMFVYAHLVGFKDYPFAFIALAYPHHAEGLASKGPFNLRSSCFVSDKPQVDPKLVQFSLPFPQPSDLNSIEAWQSYLKRAGTQLHQRMGEQLGLLLKIKKR